MSKDYLGSSGFEELFLKSIESMPAFRQKLGKYSDARTLHAPLVKIAKICFRKRRRTPVRF
jgi:hypothetical protein